MGHIGEFLIVQILDLAACVAKIRLYNDGMQSLTLNGFAVPFYSIVFYSTKFVRRPNYVNIF